MSQAPGEQPGQLATARAEELLDSMGRRIGLFAAQAGQRIQHVAASIREEADRMDQPSTAPGEKSQAPTIARTEEQGKLTMERAEDLVERLGQRLGHFTALAGFQIQKATARVREEVEDMWAEAQNIRQERSRPPQ
jgi:tRNA U34 5-carboxymethylaminomethyl modifying enzyme MnmG/GidA